MKFCKRPFEFIHLDPNGGCRLCAWTDISIGDLTIDNLEDVWMSDKANKIRDAIKNGNYEYCRKTSCPFLENDSLPDEDEETVKDYKASDVPLEYSVACDFTCNHKCPSCRNEFFKPDEEYKSKLNIILEKILPYLNRKETIKIITDGNGDCFSSPYIMSMLEKLNPENKECRITFETNGALLDEAHWNRIKHLADYRLQVTVTPNSYVKPTFEYLNGGVHSYEQVMNNLKFIRSLREQDLIKWVRISIVLQERNFWEFPEFAKRSLEEFGADEVVAKPLYKWFMLSQEDYWFKDVMNPLHPYHKEYLKMLENPELSNPRIFYWGAKNLHESKRHPAYIYKDYMDIVDAISKDKSILERKLANVPDINSKDIYIYGDTELTSVFADVLKITQYGIAGIVARDFEHDEIAGIKVRKLCDYTPNNDDLFIVMNYLNYREIARDLHFKGFEGAIMSVKSLFDL